MTRHSDRYGPAWLLMQATDGANPLLDWFATNQGRREAYWSIDTAGLFMRAAGNQEQLDVPLLILPAHVRNGMKWQTSGSDGVAVLSGSIAGGDLHDTAFGKRRVWSLHLEVADHGKWDQDFIEGRGPAGTSLAMVPLSDTPDSLPTRVAMTPSGNSPISQHAAVTSFSVIVDPATQQPEAQIGVFLPGANPEERGLHGNYPIRYFGRRMCYRIDGDALVGLDARMDTPYGLAHDYDLGPCQDATGVVFRADGKRDRIAMAEDGTAFADWPNPLHCWTIPGLQCPVIPQFPGRITGVYATASGTGLALDDGTADIHSGATSGSKPWTSFVDEGQDFVAPWAQLQNPSYFDWATNWGPWLRPLGLSTIERSIFLAPASGATMGVVFHGNGWIGHTEVRQRWQGSAPIPEPWVTLHGGLDQPDFNPIVPVLHGDNTRDLYEFSEDGLIWRRALVAGVLERTFLTAVQVPEGHQLVGVVPVAPGKLQVWTQDGTVMQWQEDVFGVGLVTKWLESAQQHVWNVGVPTAATAEPPPLWAGLQVTTTGRDVLMCAPRGRLLPDTPWTLGGASTRAIRQNEQCLLLVRAHDPDAQPAASGRAPGKPLHVPEDWLLAGTLPDVGQVVISVSESASEPITGIALARKGGGFSGPAVRAGPGFGVVERAPESVYSPLFADPRTGGQWILQQGKDCATPGTPCYRAVYFDWDSATSKAFAAPENTGGIAGPPKLVATATGFPALQAGSTTWLLDPDQGVVPMPDHVDALPGTLVAGLQPLQLSVDANSGHITQTDAKNGQTSIMQLPGAERFATCGIVDGTCAADGVCFFVVGGASANGTSRRWAIFRADRMGSGLHEVTSGSINAIGDVKGLLADDTTLVLHDGTSVLWRGFRDMEPKSCAACSPLQACLGGYCPCTFGHVSFEGYCTDQATATSFLSCAAALANGVTPTELVRIDGDGAGPSPEVLTHCDDAQGWTSMPTWYAPTGGQTYTATGCPGVVPPPPGGWNLTPSAAALHGEFEVNFALAAPTGGPSFVTALILAPLTALQADGNLAAFCGPKIVTTPGDQVIVGRTEQGMYVTTDTGSQTLPVASDGTLWLRRDAMGVIRLGRDADTLWTSSQVFKNPSRLLALSAADVSLMSLRWQGMTPFYCMPSCQGATCGDDGCGGSCGVCSPNGQCQSGTCVCNATFYGNGITCSPPIGTATLPAPSCAAALAAMVPWAATPWIDPDGAGPEPAFQQANCSASAPWTVPPQTFLDLSPLLLSDPAKDTCVSWPTGSSPILFVNPSYGLSGNFVAAGQFAAATWQAFDSKAFALTASLQLGVNGEVARVHLDAQDHFDAVTGAWTSWHAGCGGSPDLSQRVTITLDGQGLWVASGLAAPQLVSAVGGASQWVKIERTKDSLFLYLTTAGSPPFVYKGAIPDKLRVAAEVQGGSYTTVNLHDLTWL